MSHKQSNIIERDGQTLEVSFYYHLGGMNYFGVYMEESYEPSVQKLKRSA